MRKTGTLVEFAVAAILSSDSRLYGYDLMKSTNLRSGVLYPLLSRLLAMGWLTDAWEADGESKGPARRYYTLTDIGRTELTAIAATAPVKKPARRHVQTTRPAGI
jgi:PadR family transcriptional regulator PadR